MTTEQKLRDCICADPENCTQPVPGYRCRKSRCSSSQPPTSDEGTPANTPECRATKGQHLWESKIARGHEEVHCRCCQMPAPSVMTLLKEKYELERTLLAKERELAEASKNADEQMLRVKACEHIAEGTEGWEKLRNECPSTAAVAALREQLTALQSASAAPQVDGGEVFDALKAQKDAIEERNFERDLSERLSPIAFDAMRICLGKEPKTFSAKQVVAYITEVAGATPPAATDGFVMLPVEPTLDMLYIIAHDIFPDDWDVGKEAQRLGKKVPPRSEYESAYGQYKRLLAATPTPSDSKPDTEQVNK